MKIDLDLQHLYWSFRQTVDNYTETKNIDFTPINVNIEKFVSGAEACKCIIDNKELSEEEFYDMLLKFAFVSSWDEYDYRDVLNLANNHTYSIDENKPSGIIKHDFFSKNGMFYPFTLRYIRNMLKEENFKELLSKYLEHINMEIDDVTTPEAWVEDKNIYISKKYREEYKKKDFVKRLAKVRKAR